MAGSHVYSSADIALRFEACVGKTLGEIDQTGLFEGKPKNKGIAGAVVEQSVLGYPADSRREPDIEVDGISYEVKTTGVVKSKEDDGLVAKEPMSVTAVSVNTIWLEQFEDSAFWHKLEHLLLAYYLYNNGINKKVSDTREYADFPLLGWELHEWSDDDLDILRADWERVRRFVERVHQEALDPDTEYPKLSHVLNRELMYTDTSPKWPNPPRWRLKRSTVTSLVREYFEGGQALEKIGPKFRTYRDFEIMCRELRLEFEGQTVADIARCVEYAGSLASKSVGEALVVRMFGGSAHKMSGVDVFAKAGVHCKTVVFTKDGNRTEDTKLFRIDLDEIQDASVAWVDSLFFEWFGGRTLCCVFEEPSQDAPLSENVFLGFKWLPVGEEVWEEARRVWERMRYLVFSGELRDVATVGHQGVQAVNRSGVYRSAPNWPKAREGFLFVRGTGRDARDKPECVNGIRMYRQDLWIKGSWLASRLEDEAFL